MRSSAVTTATPSTMLPRIADERLRSSVRVRMVCPSPATARPSLSARSASSSWPWSRSSGVKSPADARSVNSFRRRMRSVTEREVRKNAIPAAKMKIARAAQIFGRVSGEVHCTASRIANTSARQIKTGRQNRLTRKRYLLLFFGLAFALEHVPRAAHGFQEGRMVGVNLDFFAQAANINIHAARRDEALGAPHGVQQLIAREHAVRARRQVIQQAKLERRKRHRLAVARHAIRGRIDRQTARLDHAPRL